MLQDRSPAGSSASAPLSHYQEQLWLVEQLNPGSAVHNTCRVFRVAGDLDVDALQRGFERLIRRHEALRTRFVVSGGQPSQVVDGAADLQWGVVNVDPERLDHHIHEVVDPPFDLGRAPLVRVRLFRAAQDDHVLVVVLHHLITDGWSDALLFAELSETYAAFRKGGEPGLPDRAVAYRDVAPSRRDAETDRRIAAHLGPWREKLAAPPAPLRMPFGTYEEAGRSARGAAVPVALPPDSVQRLTRIAQEEGATPFMALLAVFGAVLARSAGVQDVVVCVPMADRDGEDLAEVVGLLLNVVPVRLDLTGRPSLRKLIGQARDAIIHAYAHPVPFTRLVELLRPAGHEPGTAPAQAMLTMVPSAAGALDLAGTSTTPVLVVANTTGFDVTWAVERGPDGTLGSILQYRADLFRRDDMAALGERLRHVALAAASRPDDPAAVLDVTTPAERRRLVADWAQGGNAPHPPGLVPDSIRTWIKRTPDAPALITDARTLDYRELGRRADRVAALLRARGIGRGDVVGLLVHRDVHLLPSILGVWRAGAAYTPLDPAHPTDFLDFVVRDSRASIVISESGLLDRLSDVDVAVVAVDTVDHDVVGAAARRDLYAADPAYVIYTSGSTGAPKGAVVSHRSLHAYADWAARAYLCGDGPTVTPVHTSVSFDLTVTSLLVPLCAGHAVRLLDGGTGSASGVAGVRALHELLRQPGDLGLVKATPSHLALLEMIDQEHAGPLPASVRSLVVGGERLDLSTLARWRQLLPGARIVNEYGPTEATVGCCVLELPAGAEPECPAGVRESVWSTVGSAPIGTPIAGAELYVLDDDLIPVPSLVQGELYIGGAGLADGYLGRPGLTADRFLPNPFSVVPGTRLYRTGDLTRSLGDGTLEYLGRADDQVKIRGHRVELGHVESVLLGHPEVGAAAVVPVMDAVGATTLAAHMTSRTSPVPERFVDRVRDYLADRLPGHMVPTAWSVLDALPMTANGKVDRAALPAVAPARGAWSGERVPLTGLHRTVAEVWSDLLQVHDVGPDDNFFALGGHSMLAVRAAFLLSDMLGVELPVGDLFDADDLAAFCAGIDDRLREPPAAAPRSTIPDVARGLATAGQERLWFLWQLDPASAAYNVAHSYELRGTVDVAALSDAIDAVVADHPALRTTFAMGAGGLVQQVDAGSPGVLEIEIEHVPSSQAVADAERLANQPFDLGSGPVIRARLWPSDDGAWLLTVVVHHIVFDQWSVAVFERDLTQYYSAALDTGGVEPALPTTRVGVQPGPPESTATWDRDREHWRRKLAGAVATEIPTDHPRAGGANQAGAHYPVDLSVEVTALVARLAESARTTRFAVLLAAYAVWLSRQSGRDEVVFGVPVAGRDNADTRDAIGFFVNTLALRLDVRPAESFRDLLARAHALLKESLEHQRLPFDQVVTAAGVHHDATRNPLFQLMLAYSARGDGGAGLTLPGVDVRRLPPLTRSAAFDLTTVVEEAGDRLRFWFEYATRLFEQSTVEHLARALVDVVDAAVRAPDEPVSELLVASERESLQLAAWNRTAEPYPPVPVHELFDDQVARTPDRAAIQSGDVRLTYEQVRVRAEHAASMLRRQGASTVALCVPTGVAAVVGVLAAWKAGAAFVPLDPIQPPERLRALLASACPDAVLVAGVDDVEPMAGLVPPGCPVQPVDDGTEPVEVREASRPRHRDLNRLAYQIFTSGSTGAPKAVMIDHRGLLNHVLHQVLPLHRRAAERRGQPLAVALGAPVVFDVFLNQLVALLAGHRLVVLTDDQRVDPRLLVGLASEQETALDVVDCTTSQLRLMTDAGLLDAPFPPALVIFGGESCPPALWTTLREHPETLAYNVYGATECSVESTYTEVRETSTPTLGLPHGNTSIHIVDARLRPVPIGAVGEICIGGNGVGVGYVGQPSLTSAAFLPDPFSAVPGARTYRTGDFGRLRGDGRLDFRGRRDQQVKILGQRVELEEIEAVLRTLPGVGEAAVLLDRSTHAVERLIGYVTADGGHAAPDAEGLREALVGRLLPHTVPARFVVLDTIPLTGNGKLDRAGLARAAPAARVEPTVGPRTPTEVAVGEIWCDVLGVREVGARNDFFALGGHSMLAVRLAMALEQRFGRPVSLRLVLTRPTVEGQAAALSGSDTPLLAARTAELVPLTEPQGAGADGGPPLVLMHPVGGTVFCYRELAREIGDKRRVFGIHRDPRDPVQADFTALAEDYADLVVAELGPGSLALGGWSMGGVLAHALACAVQRRGGDVASLTLLDSFLPAEDSAVDRRDLVLLTELRAASGRADFAESLARPDVDRMLRSFGTSATELSTMDSAGPMLESWRALLSGMGRYRPSRFRGALRLVVARSHGEAEVADAVAAWRHVVTGEVSVTDVDGDHFGVLSRPAVRTVAPVFLGGSARNPREGS